VRRSSVTASLQTFRDQVLEDIAHVRVGDVVGVQIDRRELLDDFEQPVGLV
jgi:hypothetical protein